MGKAVVLYTRANCHLCEEAARELAAFGLRPEEVDVDQDDDLKRLYGDSVPVVAIDGRVRFRGHIDPVLLRRIVAAEFNDCDY